MKTTVRVSQIMLVAAIMGELSRQYPGLMVDAERVNAIAAAADGIKAAFDGLEVEAVEE